jgi:hypothetical protein
LTSKEEEKTDLIILNYNNYNYFFLFFLKNSKDDNVIFKKILKKNIQNYLHKKWGSISLIETTNKFILIPEKLYLKKDDKKYLSFVTKNDENKIKKNLSNKIMCLYTSNNDFKLKQKNIKNFHIFSLLITNQPKNNISNLQTNIFLGGDKIIISIHKNNELYYYNHFNNKNDYLKYLIILYKEYGLNQSKNLIAITSIYDHDAIAMKEKLKKYFKKISINKMNENNNIKNIFNLKN